MSTVMSADRSVPRAPASAATRWLREPLLHFVLIGALLFAVDAWRAADREDPYTIVVGAEVEREARELFERSRGRAPDAAEIKALRQAWIDNEVLYREGLALQVDRGDPAIRERVIFKALSIVDASLRLPEVDDTQLRAWFEARRERYDLPARYDFQEAVLAGDVTEADVRGFADALNGGLPGDARAGLRVYRARPHGNVAQSFGATFADALATATPGRWQALPSREGWRAVRLDAVTPGAPARFEALRGVVLQDWKDATAAAQRSAAVREMARKYDIRDPARTP